MSIAGIRSNRGDAYQILVALDWALSVLSEPNYQWIEVDAVAWQVDDTVVGLNDGGLICCQFKKNEGDFKVWTVATLADELSKAGCLLASNSKATVRFYSRSPFGALGKLREHCTTQAEEISYCASLTPEHQKTNGELIQRLTKTPTLSSFEFLRRTTFETSPEFDRMEAFLKERLRILATQPDCAFDALWRRFAQLAARIETAGISASTQHRLYKEDLVILLREAGVMLAPPMKLADIRAAFFSTSAIGRAWRRAIAGKYIANPIEGKLLAAIAAKKPAILLTGLPGSGKTCVLLAIQEVLEKRAQAGENLVPLFIQSREFADLATAQDRQAQGLPDQWVEKTARMAEAAHVVIVIDSLDVLSIAREHTVLQYFLAQIDRLLLIPNVTIVTACRDFDRHYDRRIAERKWNCELQCPALDWDVTIAPLLQTLGIDISGIDATTRQLIQNPRELALFVELAVRDGSFNVVTSQALAQRYLDTIVLADNALGVVVMQAIETIADKMLKTRSLAVPHQRFTAALEGKRALLSNNILHETQEGKLTFGHQTLLDVLVISAAVRRGDTSASFIRALSPVPFVRPSIRSFVARLATGERREFRKQIRAVLMSNTAFHIRRLVAESFAQQTPQDDDWLLMRDLRNQQRDVFQVIYLQATAIEWHFFWLKHLVPALKEARDDEGLRMHMHVVSKWKNHDAAGVLALWTEVLTLAWVDTSQIAGQFGHYFLEMDVAYATLMAPLLNTLLNFPRQPHSVLGRAVARCVSHGGFDDSVLWNYIAGDITDTDVLELQFGDKLHCAPHEFGDNNGQFLLERMKKSPALLDLAMQSVVQWSHARISGKGAFMAERMGFLRHTSYNNAHTEIDIRGVDSEEVLFRAMEAAILEHANTDSKWWHNNRERLCFSHEGALRYFGILACTRSLAANLDLIGRILCNKELLESDLRYELGTLIQKAFIYLDDQVQEAILAAVLSIFEAFTNEQTHRFWILEARAKFIFTIPCHQRSPDAQAMLNEYENFAGVLVRQPDISTRGGIVMAPFSFEVFLATSDIGIIRLLAHYAECANNRDDFLVGGKREVGRELAEAASRQATRFLRLLLANWNEIAADFRDEIMEGVAKYLSYRYGNLSSGGEWKPLEKPDAPNLAEQILAELERHPLHWHHKSAASNALQACAPVIKNTSDAARLVSLAIGFETLRERSIFANDYGDLLNTGINMLRGHVVEALLILANQFQESGIQFPELLAPALRRLAGDEEPALRALILRRLPYLQSKNPALGWDLFERAMQGDASGLWKIAERCLYYAYRDHIEKVTPLLARLYEEGRGNALETWGRISALAALANRINFTVWLEALTALNDAGAWRGAAAVWTHTENIHQHREQCFDGITAGLNAAKPHCEEVAKLMRQLFLRVTPTTSIPIKLIQRCFAIFENDSKGSQFGLYGFDEWLNTTAQRDPEYALAVIEIFLDYVKNIKSYMSDHENNLTQLLTRLFAQAEEQEESDNGVMLQRVVAVQDSLLVLGVNTINDWLKAAERP